MIKHINLKLLKEDYRKIGVVLMTASIVKSMAPDIISYEMNPLHIVFTGVFFYFFGIINTGEFDE